MKWLKKLVVNESGMTLPLALVLLAIGTLLVVPIVSLMTTSLNSTRQIDRLTKEYYSADAGIEMALWHIQYDPAFTLPPEGEPAWTSDFDLNGRTIDISISKQAGEPYKITSTATSDDGKDTTIDCYIQLAGDTGGDVWDYALVSLGGDITLSGNAETNPLPRVLGGDCYSNGDITLNGNASINGDANAVGDITIHGSNAKIEGEPTEGADPLVEPIVDTNFYKNEALLGCQVMCGDYTHTSLTVSSNQTYPSRVHVQNNLSIESICTVVFNNTVCVDGDLKISGITNVTFNGPVNVAGKIEISSLAQVAFNDTVCTQGNLTLASSKNVTFGSSIYIGGDLIVSNNINVILAGTVYIIGGINVTANANFIGAEYIFAETGDLKLSGNAKLDSEDLPFFMAIHGDVNLSGNSTTSAIIYAPEGSISISGNGDVYGCAVGESVTAVGNADIIYATEIRDRDDLPGRGGEGAEESGLQIQTYIIH